MRLTATAGALLLAAAACLAAEKPDARARFSAFQPKLRSASAAERQQAYQAYLNGGDEGRALLRTELLGLRKAMLAACREGYLPASSQDKLTTVHTKLTAARKEALRVIFDKKIYPDANHGRSGQPIVDQAVDRVKAIFPVHQRAFGPAVKRFARAMAAHQRILEVDAQLARCGATDGLQLKPSLEKAVGPGTRPELLAILVQLVDYRRHCTRVIRYNRAVFTTATDDERKLIDRTNQYRMQLGLKLLAISEPLVQAARRHSQEMARLGYFGHTSPTPANRSPGRRCANQGYRHFAGENCMSGGGPDAAFRGWYNSSGHHRNMLNPRINEIGVGHGGPWTEDLGARSSLDLDNPPRSPPKKTPPPKKP